MKIHQEEQYEVTEHAPEPDFKCGPESTRAFNNCKRETGIDNTWDADEQQYCHLVCVRVLCRKNKVNKRLSEQENTRNHNDGKENEIFRKDF